MQLNDKGQCPVCLRKPMVYKRDWQYFCSTCDRSFDMDTKEFRPNFAWYLANEPTDHHMLYGEPVWSRPMYWTNEKEPGLKLPTAIFYRLKKEKHIELINRDVPVGDPRQNDHYVEWFRGWERHGL